MREVTEEQLRALAIIWLNQKKERPMDTRNWKAGKAPVPEDLNKGPISGFQGRFRWLSNFWPCLVMYEGVEYRSLEHAYQAAKTTDPFWRDQIRKAPSPGDAKRLGKRLTMRKDWDSIKLDVMEQLVRYKFRRHRFLRECLIVGTADRELIEANTWGDRFWGVCNGEGQNHLGRILMKVRAELTAAATQPKGEQHGTQEDNDNGNQTETDAQAAQRGRDIRGEAPAGGSDGAAHDGSGSTAPEEAP